MILGQERTRDIIEAVRNAIESYVHTNTHSAYPAILTKDGDGHTISGVKIALKRKFMQPDGTEKVVEISPLDDVPHMFNGGGKVVSTYPLKKDGTGILFAMNAIEHAHLQQGGAQEAMDLMKYPFSSMSFMGVPNRTDPRKLKNVSNDALHSRSEDAKQTHEVHPTTGMKSRSVDPSDDSEDPFNNAKKFYEGMYHPTEGVTKRAMSDGVEHLIKMTHADGPSMSAKNGAHSVSVNPSGGIDIKSAIKVGIEALKHEIKAATSIEGGLTSDAVSTPALSAGRISTPGGIGARGGGAPLAAGAASDNVGALGGDLDGTLPNPIVIGCLNITNANLLFDAVDDAAAAGGGVAIGSLYRSGSALMVRIV